MLCRRVYPPEVHNHVLLLQKGGIPNFIWMSVLLLTKLRYTLKFASQVAAAGGVDLPAFKFARKRFGHMYII